MMATVTSQPPDSIAFISGVERRGHMSDRPVRVGVVGLGRRGLKLLRVVDAIGGAEVTAVAGSSDDSTSVAVQSMIESGQRPPAQFSGRESYLDMVNSDEVDLVVVATPFASHTPIMVAAMEAGKYAASEVPAALTVDDGWRLIETSERTGVPCTMLENFVYRRDVLAVLTMVQRGALGDLSHCEVGYQHDTRFVAIRDDGTPTWLAHDALSHNGNRYPTHALGPAALWTDINRGDRLEFLVSMSSRSRGFGSYASELLGAEHPLASTVFERGDVNTTLIRTVSGITMTIYFDCQTPRPRDPIFRIQGTGGIHSGTLQSVHLAGRSPAETWEPMDMYSEEFEHPMWRAHREAAEAGGLGGQNYLMFLDLVNAVRDGAQPTIDVYDAVTWSVVTELSEQSVAGRSRPVDVPDFTRGRWKDRRPTSLTQF